MQINKQRCRQASLACLNPAVRPPQRLSGKSKKNDKSSSRFKRHKSQAPVTCVAFLRATHGYYGR